MTTMPFNIRARVSSRSGASSYLKQPGDAVVVDRQGPRWLLMSCPCGCGAELPVNLDKRAGPAWRMYQSKKGTTVYPSVWRDTDCQSHFIILRDKILLFDKRHGDDWVYDDELDEDDLEKKVLAVLSTTEPQSAEQVSDEIPFSLPWDVLRCCRRLCRRGLVSEGRGSAAGTFLRC